jgi:signal transduction histidine kinase
MTIAVAAAGMVLVSRYVTGSLSDRLDNYLVSSGRAVANNLVSYERRHRESANFIAVTEGMGIALQESDREVIVELAIPAALNYDLDALLIVDADGDLMLHMLKQAGQLVPVDVYFDPTDVQVIRELLQAGEERNPLNGIGRNPGDNRYYYFTAMPVTVPGGELVGVVMVGTALDTLLPQLKSASLADVVIYTNGGQVLGSTFTTMSSEDQEEMNEALAISEDEYQRALQSESYTYVENIRLPDMGTYRIARGPLLVANRRLGAFGVASSTEVITDTGAASRQTYGLILTGAVGAVILIGLLVSVSITSPLGRLVRTSQAIADGDLEQRTGIRRRDEIGVLARTFDRMTDRLADRTEALQTSLRDQRETASRMRSILSSIGDGVLWENPDGDFIPLNAAAETMLEEMAQHFLSGPMRELTTVGQTELDEVNPWLLESRRFQVANRVYTVHSANVSTDEGEQLGTVIVLRDVTAEVEAEQLKDAFVAHVSHELRTPLTSIKGYTSLLMATTRSKLDEAQRDFIVKISKQTDNLISMINALLDFSEVEASGRLGLRQKPLLVSEVIEDIYAEWQPRMEEKELNFSLEMDLEDQPLVNGDQSRLEWAVVNLVRNAWQYTPEGGSVTIRLSANYDRVTLDVIDTGMGIPPEDQRRLFSRFYRVMHDHDDDVRGLGLGLYVTKAIVEAHGGYIQVMSEVGEGSTFSLVLPAMPETETERVAV